MKLLLSIVVFLLSLNNKLSAQNTDTILVDLDTLSDEMASTFGYRNYRIPGEIYISKYLLNGAPGKTVETDELYSIGLSEDGKYAFAIEPYAENCDCYFVEFYIVDLANDNEVLYFSHYDNESWQRSWDKASGSDKDSLREVHKCSYMKCAWYQVYNALSAEMFKYGIKQTEGRSYYRGNELSTDDRFNRIYTDTTDDGLTYTLQLFFEHDTDTLQYTHPPKDLVEGMNYHGYLSHPELSDWQVLVMSERHLGLDTAKTEVWRYVIAGVKRNQDLPYTKNKLLGLEAHKSLNARIEKPYRKMSLVEQMYDRVVNLEMREWLRSYQRNLDVFYHDKEDGIFPYKRSYSDFREQFKKEGDEFYLDRSFPGMNGEYYVFGSKQEDESVNELTQLIHYNEDSVQVDAWYDFSDEIEHGHGGIRFVLEEDSLIYVSVGSDFTNPDVKHYGRIYCIDKTRHQISWMSDPLTANAESFILVNDVLICGYAVSEQDSGKDKLYMINKYNGETVKDITLPDSPVWIVNDNDRVIVKTPVSIHEFDIKSSFFETF